MTKKLLLPLITVALALLAACNSGSDTYEYTAASSAIVKSFSLTDDDEVLDSLSNVFFAIDLDKAQIFNADSLPYGTKTDRLIPVIETESTVGSVTLEIPRPNMSDSIVNFLENSTDSVDFSNGPVKLRIISQSGTTERVYEIHVNVHQVKPDTLAWARVETRPNGIPTAFAASDLGAVKVLRNKNVYYAISSNKAGTELCVYNSNNPDFIAYGGIYPISVGENIDVASAVITEDAFVYMLNAEGHLWKGMSNLYSDLGEVWHSILGTYGNDVIGTKKVGDSWKIVTYPSNKEWDMPEGFPVTGASQPIDYDFDMAFSSQMILVGGFDANGARLASTWGFDGTSWACYKSTSLPKGIDGLSIAPYHLFYVPISTWRPVEYPALIAFGGRDDEGVNRTVYVSQDWGLTWREGSELMQLPAAVDIAPGAMAYVYYDTRYVADLAASRSADWQSVDLLPLPPFCSWVNPQPSRVEKPVTQWQVPEIYVYGGTKTDGTPQTTIWRGVVLRYTFAPTY